MRTMGVVMLASLALAARGAAAAGEPVVVSAAWLSAHLKDPGVVVLHVAAQADGYAKEHIPGARSVTRAEIVEDGGLGAELPAVEELAAAFSRAGVSNQSRVVIYGESALLAARAFFTLEYLGHDRVAVLDGGLAAWKAGGHPTTAEAPSAAAGAFTPRVRADRLADAAWIQAHVADPGVSIVDARTMEEYTGADGGRHAGFVVSAGHVPGAKLVDWTQLVSSAQVPTLVGRDELAARLGAAGVKATGTAVSYCTIGMRASFAYLVARHLGYDAKMYDGSMTDWTRRELPVEKDAPK